MNALDAILAQVQFAQFGRRGERSFVQRLNVILTQRQDGQLPQTAPRPVRDEGDFIKVQTKFRQLALRIEALVLNVHQSIGVKKIETANQ